MEASVKAQLTESINETLQQLRPFFEADGGDITLVNITADFIVEVALHGSCGTCDMSMMTLKNGVEESLKKAAPQIKGVRAVPIPETQA
jgi:Fe-S cluster biogenesis protein NfuA